MNPLDGISVLLTCELCKKQVGYLSAHLKKVHKMASLDYQMRYPGERLTGRRQIEYQQSVNQDQDRIQCAICGQSFLLITGKHLRFHGMTVPEYRRLFPDRDWKTVSVKRVSSEKARQHVLRQHQDPKFKESLRRGMMKSGALGREKMRQLNESPSYRQAISQKGKAWWAGLSSQEKSKHIKKSVGGRYRYKDRLDRWHTMRSRMEVVIAFWLDIQMIHWDYETVRLKYLKDTVERVYVPDFVLIDCYLEVKASTFRWNKKTHLMVVPDLPLFVITEKDAAQIGLKTVRHWLMRKFKKYDSISLQKIQERFPALDVFPLRRWIAQSFATMSKMPAPVTVSLSRLATDS